MASNATASWRSRWAAVAAAAVVAVGGGGALLTSDAAGVQSSFVAVTPARILDTRTNVGLTGKFVSETARLLTVTGSVPTTAGTQIVVPTGATAVVMNVTVVSPSASGFFSVRPGDAAGAPGTSNLNFNSGVVVPNSVTVELPPAGNINLYYFGGTVGATTDVLIDVVGYFTAGGAGPVGVTGSDGDDGVLGPDQGRTVLFTTTADNAGNDGTNASIAIGVDGMAIIAHGDASALDLRVTHCLNTSCTASTTTALDTASASGVTPAIAIGSDGLPIIAHQLGSPDFDLRVTHCDNVACTSATHVTVDTDNDTGYAPSITIGTDGFPIIAYQKGLGTELRVTHCSNLTCSSATTVSVDVANAVGYEPSIAIGTDGFAIIAHQDQTTFDLRVTHCSDTACSAATSASLDVSADDVGNFPSIAIGTDGLPIIAHYDATGDNLRITHCANVSCTSATHTSVDTANDVGNTPSMTIGVDGLPVIVHMDQFNGQLRLTHCSDVGCTAATTVVVATSGVSPSDPSVAIGGDSHLLLAYKDVIATSLSVTKVQHMSWTLNGWES